MGKRLENEVGHQCDQVVETVSVHPVQSALHVCLERRVLLWPVSPLFARAPCLHASPPPAERSVLRTPRQASSSECSIKQLHTHKEPTHLC